MKRILEHRGLRKQLSIRNVLLVLLVGEIAVVVGFTWWIWYRNGQEAVAEVEQHLRRELTARVHQHIEQFVAMPALLNSVNFDAYNMGRLGIEDVAELEDYLWRQLKTFESVGYISVGTEEGDFIGLERMEDGTINLELKSTQTDGALYTFTLDTQRRRTSKKVRPDYHTRDRPWYTAAIDSGGPTWTRIYPFFSLPSRLGITAVRPIRDPDGTVRGVVGCDLILTQIDDFLQGLEVGKTGRTFIIERDGMLVASSSRVHKSTQRDGDQLERIHVLKFEDEMVRAAADYLKGQFDDFTGIESEISSSFMLNGDRILLQARPIRDEAGLDWLAVVLLPESDFMGPIDSNTRLTGFIFAILLVIAGVTILATTQQISKPIRAITMEMDAIAAFNVEESEQATSILHEISVMQNSMTSMKRGLRSFGKYVPIDVVSQLFKSRREATLGVERAEVTIFFSDIVGFTSIAESLSPKDLVELTGEYFEEMSNIILEADGTVDKYMGDAIMAFWNAPESVANHPTAGVCAALACEARLAELRESWQARGLPVFHQRIGLHTGNVLLGNLGSKKRFNYTVIGDAVNLAQRLESLNKIYGTAVMISEEVYCRVKDVYLCMPLDVVAVKGKSDGTKIYTVVSEQAKATETQRNQVEIYSRALVQYADRAFAEASETFDRYLNSWPDDIAAQALCERCKEFEGAPPGANWKGIHRLHEK